MKLKKLFAGILAVAMMATMAAPAFAAGTDNGYSVGTPKITVNENREFEIEKKYIKNDNGTIPDETFHLTVTKDSVTNSTVTDADFKTAGSYELTVEDARIANGVVSNFKITLPEITKPGVFKYKLTEDNNGIAGVTYDNATYELTVYATQRTKVNKEDKSTTNDIQYSVRLDRGKTDTAEAANKVKEINNSYAAEPLTITKTVNGNMGDRTREFEFAVKFKAPAGKTVKSVIQVAGEHGNVTDVKGGTLTNGVLKFDDNATEVSLNVKLKHGQTVNFTNLPKDVEYTVAETRVEGYKTYINNSDADNNEIEGKIEDTAVTIDYENVNGDTTIDTGVILDNAPYIALMMVVVAGAAVMIIKKRRHFED